MPSRRPPEEDDQPDPTFILRPPAVPHPLLQPLLPGVEPCAKPFGKQTGEGIRGHPLRAQHTRLGHAPVVADNLRQRR
jgi:hypothetical protein